MVSGKLSITTTAKMELVNITAELQRVIRSQSISSGVLYVFNPHTTAGLTINEGADPAVQEDLIAALQKIVPSNVRYKHLEGNSPAHMKTSLFGSSEMIFFEKGSLKLGTWQRIFFCEFDGPRSRKMHWRLLQA